MYHVNVNLTDEDKERGKITIQVETKGQARKVKEALSDRDVEVVQTSVKVITF